MVYKAQFRIFIFKGHNSNKKFKTGPILRLLQETVHIKILFNFYLNQTKNNEQGKIFMAIILQKY